MARIILSICDLCKETSSHGFMHEISLSANSFHTKEDGEICSRCWAALTERLKQEGTPVLPRVTQKSYTPSEKATPPAPSLDAGEPTEELLENELTVVKSNLTPEARRAVDKARREKGCLHDKGFSFSSDGIVCKICGEKVKF